MAEEDGPMNADDDTDLSRTARFQFPASRTSNIGVHVLSEFVFCPRAAVIASESGRDEGDEEPNLGPRLDLVIDYNEHRFVEALQQSWGEMRLWLTLMALAMLVAMVAGSLHSLTAGVILSLPVFVMLAKCWDTLANIIALVREQALFRSAPEMVVDLEPTEVKRLSWWSLRKAGFDCQKPPELFDHPAGHISGKPWRLLRRGSLMIPVIRRRLGNSEWGTQHEVRLSAYCDLIEKCTGGDTPFGVILFAGTSDCIIIPNNKTRQTTYERSLRAALKFMGPHRDGPPPTNPPTDTRCSSCPHGKPRVFQPGKSETVLNGKSLTTCAANSVRPDGQFRGEFHSTCGDRFRWTPPHKDAVDLNIAKDD
jgi:hypothetical protein